MIKSANKVNISLPIAPIMGQKDRTHPRKAFENDQV